MGASFSVIAMVASICPVVSFVLVILFRPVKDTVFLDKVCINQTDSQKKQDGIDGLGGFIKHSKKLMVLWDPSYFTRLWCTLEMAATVYLSDVKIEFVPIYRGYGVFICMLVLNSIDIVSIPLTICSNVLGVDSSFMNDFITGFMTVCFLTILTHHARAATRERIAIRKQLKEFACTNASCFCCSVNHKMPGSNEAIDCDRTAIYDAIQECSQMALMGLMRKSTIRWMTL